MITDECSNLQRISVNYSPAHRQGVAWVDPEVAYNCSVRGTGAQNALHDLHGLTVLRHLAFVFPYGFVHVPALFTMVDRASEGRAFNDVVGEFGASV